MATNRTRKSGSPPDEPGQSPQTAWQRMTREERIAWVETHRGQQIRYAKRDEVEKGRKAFGPSFPIPWHETPLYGLAVDYRGRPSLAVKGPLDFGVFGDTMHEPWDGLWDVRLASDEAEDADGEAITTIEGYKRRVAELEQDNRFLTRRIAALGTHVPELWEIADRLANNNPMAHRDHDFFQCVCCGEGGQDAMNPTDVKHLPECAWQMAREMVKSKPTRE